MKDKIIKEKLAKLEKTIEALKYFQKIPKDKFVSSERVFFGPIYALVIGIEIICDIGNHILSYYFGRQAETYKEIIELLAEVEVIPQKFAKRTVEMTKFRNLAIHVYAKVDPKKVYKYIPQAIKQFKVYSRYFLKFLEG